MTLSIPMVRVPMKKFPFVALMAALLFAGLGWPQRHAFCASGAPISKVLALPNASLLMEEDGHMRISRHADRPMVPASTMKILTALASIQRWGMGHRFHTDFHMTGDGRLWVKGEGDPYLISEELDRIVATLAREVGNPSACSSTSPFPMGCANRWPMRSPGHRTWRYIERGLLAEDIQCFQQVQVWGRPKKVGANISRKLIHGCPGLPQASIDDGEKA